MPPDAISNRGRNLALVAALLGWMFDGMEMGLFPLVGKSALRDLSPVGTSATSINDWFAVINAGFLVGAATGGVLFGWLGDRIGRVRAMTLSVLVYAGCSGFSAFSAAPWQLAVLRFTGALGMGGEWALGVALVMEMWPNASRAWLAGLIGAFGNLGYFVLACIALLLNRFSDELTRFFVEMGMAKAAGSGNWRILMFVGALPAILTLLIRLFVPESEKWVAEKKTGKVSNWSGKDLLAVLFGAAIGGVILSVWIHDTWTSVTLMKLVGGMWPARILATVVGLSIITVCFLFPARQYLLRSGLAREERRRTLGRMLLAAGLSGVPLLATWGGVMWVYNWVDVLAPTNKDARPLTQAASAFGAAVGCVLAAWLGGLIGRKPAYAILCILSAITLYGFYTLNTEFGVVFVATAGLVGMITAAFYGWLPLYLPELFKTGIRATGQGFGFNFGRILAAVGSLQTGALLTAFDGDYARACSIAAGVYVFGLVLICFAPETKGKPLPE
jgi:SHS family sialic acid transporter-like MFS transporter